MIGERLLWSKYTGLLMGLQLNTEVSVKFVPSRFRKNYHWIVSWVDKYKERRTVVCNSTAEVQALREKVDPEMIAKKGLEKIEEEIKELERQETEKVKDGYDKAKLDEYIENLENVMIRR